MSSKNLKLKNSGGANFGGYDLVGEDEGEPEAEKPKVYNGGGGFRGNSVQQPQVRAMGRGRGNTLPAWMTNPDAVVGGEASRAKVEGKDGKGGKKAKKEEKKVAKKAKKEAKKAKKKEKKAAKREKKKAKKKEKKAAKKASKKSKKSHKSDSSSESDDGSSSSGSDDEFR